MGKLSASETTALQESLHCVGLGLYQITGNSINKNILMDLEKFRQAFDKYCECDVDAMTMYRWASEEPSWVDSVVNNVNVLVRHRLFKGKYKFYRGIGMMELVYKVFREVAGKDGISLANDKWNPGDIWAFTTNAANKFKSMRFNSLAEYNLYISEQLSKGEILGISLKKSGGSPKVDYVKQSDNVKPKVYKYEGTQKPAKIFSTGITVLTDSHYKINMRSFRISQNQPIQTELGISGSSARHGKKTAALFTKKYNIPQTSLSDIKMKLKKPDVLKEQVVKLWKENGYTFTKSQVEEDWKKANPEYTKGNQASGYFFSIINALEFGAFLHKNKNKSSSIINNIIVEASSKSPNSSDFLKVY